MNRAVMQDLIETGYCWSLSYYQSLRPDPETDFSPQSHFQVTVITSQEDQVEGWRPTADAAALDALCQLTLHRTETRQA